MRASFRVRRPHAAQRSWTLIRDDTGMRGRPHGDWGPGFLRRGNSQCKVPSLVCSVNRQKTVWLGRDECQGVTDEGDEVRGGSSRGGFLRLWSESNFTLPLRKRQKAFNRGVLRSDLNFQMIIWPLCREGTVLGRERHPGHHVGECFSRSGKGWGLGRGWHRTWEGGRRLGLTYQP